MTYKTYEKTKTTEMRPYIDGEHIDEDYVSINRGDKENGSPKAGDMIARDPSNHDDMWLISREFFVENYCTVSNEESEHMRLIQRGCAL